MVVWAEGSVLREVLFPLELWSALVAGAQLAWGIVALRHQRQLARASRRMSPLCLNAEL